MENDFTRKVDGITEIALRPFIELAEGKRTVADMVYNFASIYASVVTKLYKKPANGTIQEACKIEQNKYNKCKRGVVEEALLGIENGVPFDTCKMISYSVVHQLLIAGIDAEIVGNWNGHYNVETKSPNYEVDALSDFLAPKLYEIFLDHEKYLNKIIYTIKTNELEESEWLISQQLEYFLCRLKRNEKVGSDECKIMIKKTEEMYEGFYDFMKDEINNLDEEDFNILKEYFSKTEIPHLKKCSSLFNIPTSPPSPSTHSSVQKSA